MATQKGGTFIGRKGPLLFYDRLGTRCVRAFPVRGIQTKATKLRAAEFGKASGLAKTIRKIIIPVIPFPSDHNMQTRLITVIFQWLKSSGSSQEERLNNLAKIGDFQFTTSGDSLRNRWNINPVITIPSAEILQIKIPAFIPKQSISAPAHTKSVTLKLTAGSFNPETGVSTGSSSEILLFDYNKKKLAAQTYSLKFPMPKESLVLIGVSLEYTVSNSRIRKLNRDKAFLPAAIIAAMYLQKDL